MRFGSRIGHSEDRELRAVVRCHGDSQGPHPDETKAEDKLKHRSRSGVGDNPLCAWLGRDRNFKMSRTNVEGRADARAKVEMFENCVAGSQSAGRGSAAGGPR